MQEMISVVVRTMPGREKFLEKCLFILQGQRWRNIEVIVVAQASVHNHPFELIKNIIAGHQHSFRKLQFLHHTSNQDARAKSLNIGKQAATGRYLAFLDDDDKIRSGHYERLITSLKESDHAWAYCDTVRAVYNKAGQLVERSLPFKRNGYFFLDHLKANFMPIHSFVMDTHRVRIHLDVDETLDKNEDYDFSLRLAFRHEPLYVPLAGAEYCIRLDGSNTVGEWAEDKQGAALKKLSWELAAAEMDALKAQHFGWWVREAEYLDIDTFTDAIARGLGRSDTRLRDELRAYYASTSWRMTAPLRRFKCYLLRQPLIQPQIPQREREALLQIQAIRSSSSWKLTAPMRVLKKLMSRNQTARLHTRRHSPK